MRHTAEILACVMIFPVLVGTALQGAPSQDATGPGTAVDRGRLVDSSPQDDCAASREQVLDLPASGLDALRVASGSGAVEVRGEGGRSAIRVRAIHCASSQALLEALSTTLEASGATAVVDTDYPSFERVSGSRRYARIDLVVEVPAGLAADITDGSGAIFVAGVGELGVEDGSGEIEVVGSTGALTVVDGSGEMRLRDIRGDVVVTDGSGEIVVQGVEGSVRVEADGSGSIEIANVTGDVRIATDGSGSIDVETVGGDFSVGTDSSGSIDYRDITGTVEIPRRGRRGGR